MNTLELKRVILTQIAELDDPEALQEILDFLNSKLIMPDSESDGWSDLPPEAQQELLEAIERSKKNDPENWVSHEEVMKQARQWLQNQR
jgi:hypothetical protein